MAVLTLAYATAAELVAAEGDVAVMVILRLSKEVVAVSVGNRVAEVVILRPSIEEGEPHVPFPLLT